MHRGLNDCLHYLRLPPILNDTLGSCATSACKKGEILESHIPYIHTIPNLKLSYHFLIKSLIPSYTSTRHKIITCSSNLSLHILAKDSEIFFSSGDSL